MPPLLPSPFPPWPFPHCFLAPNLISLPPLTLNSPAPFPPPLPTHSHPLLIRLPPPACLCLYLPSLLSAHLHILPSLPHIFHPTPPLSLHALPTPRYLTPLLPPPRPFRFASPPSYNPLNPPPRPLPCSCSLSPSPSHASGAQLCWVPLKSYCIEQPPN